MSARDEAAGGVADLVPRLRERAASARAAVQGWTSNQSDIGERLRAQTLSRAALNDEVADEIERLRARDQASSAMLGVASPRDERAVTDDRWQPIETAPKNTLIDIWIKGNDGEGTRWASCYYDSICGEWRTSRPGGKLVWIRESAVTHWRPDPGAPKDRGEATSPSLSKGER